MNALEHTQELVRFPTVSNLSNASICEYLENVLVGLGFTIERIDYTDRAGVRKVNIVGKKGTGTGGMAYFAHTDTVPADSWFSSEHGPFEPRVSGDRLYGRGSCDMKGSIGSMLAAVEQSVKDDLRAPLYIALTADEEVGYCGAIQVAQRSRFFQEMVQGETNGIVGEPTMLKVVHAHKGTYGFRATSHGKAAHSSTNEGVNANLAMIPFLSEMKRIHDETGEDPAWQHSDFDPPGISWNIGINDHMRAVNVTPERSVCTVYFRPAPGHDAECLIERARSAAAGCGVDFELLWAGQPLHTNPDSKFVREVLELSGCERSQTVCYGTDGAALTGMRNLVVLGPGDIAQAHTRDEWILLDQLEQGSRLYAKLIRHWCT
ncbi:MAG: M20 family metallopeptidase [Bryobacterales bacterium]|nr:M20 family metallopeptidase [Bryobacterales bacterium]